MKKFLSLSISLLFISTASAESDFIFIANHDTDYKMMVSYQICTINRAIPSEPICELELQATLEKGQPVLKIPVDNWVFDVRVTNATELDTQGNVIAESHFPGEEDCKGFTHETLILGRYQEQRIECIKSPPML